MTAVEIDTRVVVDSCGARRRLRALIALGWPAAELARRLGGVAVGDLIERPVGAIPGALHAQVCALYGQLSRTAGPCTAVRGLAAQRGWPPPLAWGDDSLDDPGARPARRWWSPATGPTRSLVDRYSELQGQHLGQRQIVELLGVTARRLVGVLHRHHRPIHPELAAAAEERRRHCHARQRVAALLGRDRAPGGSAVTVPDNPVARPPAPTDWATPNRHGNKGTRHE